MNTTPGLESYTRLHTHPGDTIFFLTEGVSHQYPMIQHFDLVSTSRGAHQWILPGAYLKTLNQNDPQYDTAIKIYNLAVDVNINDLISKKPDFIYAYNGINRPYFHQIRYDYIAEMRKKPRFEDFIAQYQKTYEDNAFIVFARKTAPSVH